MARGAQAREYEAAEGMYATKMLAFMVQEALDEYKKANPDFAVSSSRMSLFAALDSTSLKKPSDTPRPRGTLLITDRSMDTMAPFIHEFTYQAMANDLLNIEDGKKYRYVSVNQEVLAPLIRHLSGISSSPQMIRKRTIQPFWKTRTHCGQLSDICTSARPLINSWLTSITLAKNTPGSQRSTRPTSISTSIPEYSTYKRWRCYSRRHEGYACQSASVCRTEG